MLAWQDNQGHNESAYCLADLAEKRQGEILFTRSDNYLAVSDNSKMVVLATALIWQQNSSSGMRQKTNRNGNNQPNCLYLSECIIRCICLLF